MKFIYTSKWVRRLTYIFVLVLTTLAFLILVAMIHRTWFNDPPLRVQSLDSPFGHPLCPGEQHDAHNQITVDEPVIIFSYFSVMDEGENFNIGGTQVTNGPRPHPHASVFTQTLPWTVPALLPGKYSRVLAFRSADGRENSIFVSAPFQIGENCNE